MKFINAIDEWALRSTGRIEVRMTQAGMHYGVWRPWYVRLLALVWSRVLFWRVGL